MSILLKTEIAESNAQVVARVLGKDRTRGELNEAFKRVQNKRHWKLEIDTRVILVDDEELFMVREAVIFFTGSVPTFDAEGHSVYRVRAAGYFQTIGA